MLMTRERERRRKETVTRLANTLHSSLRWATIALLIAEKHVTGDDLKTVKKAIDDSKDMLREINTHRINKKPKI
tara:strand:- start:478 stop:699 length:222 start_codon:yes stop_codon:yes gene_type:complete